MIALLVVIIVLDSLILLGITVGLYLAIRDVGRAARAAEGAIDDIRRGIVPALKAAEGALQGIEALAARSEKEVERLGGVLRSIDRVVSGAAVAAAAAAAFKSTRSTAATILAALKEGLQAFRKPAGGIRED